MQEQQYKTKTIGQNFIPSLRLFFFADTQFLGHKISTFKITQDMRNKKKLRRTAAT